MNIDDDFIYGGLTMLVIVVGLGIIMAIIWTTSDHDSTFDKDKNKACLEKIAIEACKEKNGRFDYIGLEQTQFTCFIDRKLEHEWFKFYPEEIAKCKQEATSCSCCNAALSCCNVSR